MVVFVSEMLMSCKISIDRLAPSFLLNRHHAIGGYGDVDLDSYVILCLAPELFNLQMLPQPLEEQFYLPPVVIQSHHFFNKLISKALSNKTTFLANSESRFMIRFIFSGYLLIVCCLSMYPTASGRTPAGNLRFHFIGLKSLFFLPLITKYTPTPSMVKILPKPL